MKNVLKIATGTFAVIPGLAVLGSGLGIPPESGLKLVFGGIIEAFGVLSLLLITVNGAWIRSLSKRAITIATIITAGLGFVFLLAYIGCYFYCVVTVDPRGMVYFPLWNGGELARMVADTGSRSGAIDFFGRYAVYDAVKHMGQLPEIVTNSVFLVLYTGVFTLLTWALGLPAMHETPVESVAKTRARSA